jgi:hypothetical protein
MGKSDGASEIATRVDSYPDKWEAANKAAAECRAVLPDEVQAVVTVDTAPLLCLSHFALLVTAC